MNNIKQIPISQLVKADWNYKKEDKKTSDRLRNAIKNRGQLVLTIVRQLEKNRYEIVNGNHGYDIYKELGYEEVTCIDLGKISLEDAKQIALETNELRFASDDIRLGGLLKDLKEKYSLQELTKSLPYSEQQIDTKIEMYDIEYGEKLIYEDKEIKTNIGDIWELGNHRLICGDSMESDHVNSLLSGVKVDLVFTDPPYDFNETKWFYNAINNCDRNIFVMQKDINQVELCSKFKKYFKRFFVLTFDRCIFTSATTPMLGHNLISHFCKSNQNMKNMNDGFSTTTTGYNKSKQYQQKDHKHAKDVDFVEKFILHYSVKGNTVLDLFAGAGSTLVACENTNRIFYGVEINPHNIALIVLKWIKLMIDNKRDISIKKNGEVFIYNDFRLD
jgi:DNA modification methylase